MQHAETEQKILNLLCYAKKSRTNLFISFNCAIVSARVLSNGGVLPGNKLMSGSTGGACCYVRPPLNIY